MNRDEVLYGESFRMKETGERIPPESVKRVGDAVIVYPRMVMPTIDPAKANTLEAFARTFFQRELDKMLGQL